MKLKKLVEGSRLMGSKNWRVDISGGLGCIRFNPRIKQRKDAIENEVIHRIEKTHKTTLIPQFLPT